MTQTRFYKTDDELAVIVRIDASERLEFFLCNRGGWERGESFAWPYFFNGEPGLDEITEAEAAKVVAGWGFTMEQMAEVAPLAE